VVLVLLVAIIICVCGIIITVISDLYGSDYELSLSNDDKNDDDNSSFSTFSKLTGDILGFLVISFDIIIPNLDLMGYFYSYLWIIFVCMFKCLSRKDCQIVCNSK